MYSYMLVQNVTWSRKYSYDEDCSHLNLVKEKQARYSTIIMREVN